MVAVVLMYVKVRAVSCWLSAVGCGLRAEGCEGGLVFIVGIGGGSAGALG